MNTPNINLTQLRTLAGAQQKHYTATAGNPQFGASIPPATLLALIDTAEAAITFLRAAFTNTDTQQASEHLVQTLEPYNEWLPGLRQ